MVTYLVVDWLCKKIVSKEDKKFTTEAQVKLVILKVVMIDGIDKIDRVDEINELIGLMELINIEEPHWHDRTIGYKVVDCQSRIWNLVSWILVQDY